ncbi:sulfatase [Prosthecobacter sp. SYSU 5D2]|uniref:sulfatase n=1 Tax=Prosthecobacter sp. SYSU 5D2 TaxID=3134134 RepID=UPI0031FE8A25
MASLFCLVCGTVAAQTPDRPNVVLILADDLGWSDTTLHGTTKYYQTPNIDRLAKRGMTFTRGYSASPLCSPTRSAILTGLSPARTGITTPNCHLPKVVLQATQGKAAPADKKSIAPDPVTRLNTTYPTLAKTLKAAGYATAHFGKWHLGPEPYSPLEQGFDVDIPHWSGPGPAGSFVAPWKYADFKENSPGEHIEDRMAAEASAWMEQHKDAPFYVNYWQFSVHAPFDAKKALIEKHRQRIDPADPQRSPTYAAMVESMDDAVGTLLDTLDRLKIADRTIVIFTSDNGGNMYNEVDGTTPTSNTPLRGGKATMFEGGVRVPLIVAWPGVTEPASRSDALVQSEDFYPTLLEGLSLSPEANQIFDGASILPALKGGDLPGKAVFQYFPHDPGVPDWLPPAVSVHRGDWKLIRIFHGGEKGAHRHLLYDLNADLGEQNNLAAQKTELVTELGALIDGFLAETKAVLPVANPAFDPAKYRPELEGKQKPKGAAKAPPRAVVGGWQSSKQAQITVEKGALKVKSTGGDPWIATQKLPAKAQGPFTVKLRLKSSAKGPGLIYFNRTAKEPFHKDRSVPVAVKHDGQFHDYEVKLPAKTIQAFRIDPAAGAGEIVLTQVELTDAAGSSVNLVP